MHTVGSEEGAGVGDDVGTLDGAKVGELVGGSGSMHRVSTHMLSSEQHASSTPHMKPGRTHILSVGAWVGISVGAIVGAWVGIFVGAIVGAWVGIAVGAIVGDWVGATVGSGVSGAIIFMVGLAVVVAATVVTIGSGAKSKSMQSLFACGLNSNPLFESTLYIGGWHVEMLKNEPIR